MFLETIASDNFHHVLRKRGLTYLPIGFNNQMHGYFLTLCLAYGLYVVGNVNILLLMYFADYKGAKKLAKHFAILTVVLSFGSQFLDSAFLGYAFLISSLVLFHRKWSEIDKYTSDLSVSFLRKPNHGI